MKTTKQLLLTVAVLFISATAKAHDFEVDGIYYKITSETSLNVKVTYKGSVYNSYDNEYSDSLIIPNKVIYNNKEYNVESIDNSTFRECTTLTSITIPNSVSSVGDGVFDDCVSLKYLNVADGETTLSFGKSIKRGDECAFYDCPLKKVYLGRNLKNGAYISSQSPFSHNKTLESVIIGSFVTKIRNNLFWDCGNLIKVEMSNSITQIGGSAFADCLNLIDINIPEKTIRIEDFAFYNCKSLKNVTIPDHVISLGLAAFEGCSGLTSVIIPNSVMSIRERAFSGCTGLTSVTIPNGVKSIVDTFLGCTSLTSVTIPNGVKSIDGAFSGCTGLTSITIPNSVTSIGYNAFENCTGLTSVTIPNSVTSIKNSAFYGCNGLTSIEIPNSVTSIAGRTFANCTGLTSVIIPNSVTSIEGNTFDGCTGLTSIEIPNSVTEINAWAFKGCTSITSVTIPNSVTKISSQSFEGCTGLTEIKVENGNNMYDSRNDCNAIIETANNNLKVGCNTTVIPNSVTSISGGAFMGQSNLTQITIPSSVVSFGSSVFKYCDNLKSIYMMGAIPPTVKENTFTEENYVFATVYVPTGTSNAYKTADIWKTFFNIKEFDATAIENIHTEAAITISDDGISLSSVNGKPVAIYTTTGALVEKIDSYTGEEIVLDKGVYIVRTGNKTIKVKL